MARIQGVDIPRDKRVEVSITYIHGIGRSTSKKILATADIDLNIRVKDLSEDQINTLRQVISDLVDAGMLLEGDLKREVQSCIRRKIEIGCYQGHRWRRGLPVRGQRTKTNARTRKGKKRTVAGKKKAKK